MTFWHKQPHYPLCAENIEILSGASHYREQLLSMIGAAQQRIYLTALYLQDDEAGTQVLDALHQVSLQKPHLEIRIFVDYHRAQRGLMGAEKSEGNVCLYREMLERYDSSVEIYGVPVKSKEMFGVLHLKGFVIDDTVLYSGASINNIYLQHEERYRLDRYFLLHQKALSDAMVDFIHHTFIESDAVVRLDKTPIAPLSAIQGDQKELLKSMKRSNYPLPVSNDNEQMGGLNARIFVGIGRRGNKLNRLIKSLFSETQEHLVLYTPYFNLPSALQRALNKLLRKGKKVTIVVGDKTANDFYQSPDLPFTKSSALPYLYETILYKFVKNKKSFIDNGQLEVLLWWHENNSFHLKGVSVDDRYHLLTGHNLNPRAWGLDIENGILIDDAEGVVTPAIDKERINILQYCKKITSYHDLQHIDDYPEPVQKLLKKARKTKVDVIIKRFI